MMMSGYSMGKKAFDTLNYVESLEKAGVPGPQAKAQAQALAVVLENHSDQLVTKEDIGHLRDTMQASMKHLEERMEGRIDQLEERMEGRIVQVEEKINQRLEAQGMTLRQEIKESHQALSQLIAVQGEQLKMIRWVVGGTFFGIFILILRTFWPLHGVAG